jgi:hypothetical protein
MKIIREKLSNRVIYFFSDSDEVILSESHLSGKTTDVTLNSLDFELIENAKPLSLPVIYGSLIYTDGFYPLDQDAFNAAQSADEEAQRVQAIFRQMTAIESSVTPRRQREAILGTDNGWFADQDAAIAALRAQL